MKVNALFGWGRKDGGKRVVECVVTEAAIVNREGGQRKGKRGITLVFGFTVGRCCLLFVVINIDAVVVGYDVLSNMVKWRMTLTIVNRNLYIVINHYY